MGYMYLLVFCVLVVFIGFEVYVYYLRPRQVRIKLNEALKYHPDWKRIKRTERLFDELYRHVRGKAISGLTPSTRFLKNSTPRPAKSFTICDRVQGRRFLPPPWVLIFPVPVGSSCCRPSIGKRKHSNSNAKICCCIGLRPLVKPI